MSIRTRFNPLGTIGRKALLPAGYIELEYLEANQNQWIDTGVLPWSDMLFYIDAEAPGADANLNYALNGSTWNNNPGVPGEYRVYPWHVYNNGVTVMVWGQNNVHYINETDLKYTGRIAITVDGTKVVINGDVIPFSVTSPASQCGDSIYIFNRHNPLTPSAPAGYAQKIFEVKLDNHRGGKVHMIPALDPTGRPCMYDLVGKKPYYNKGTGEFKCGYKLPTGYTQVNGIYFDNYTGGTILRCYVDAGFRFKQGGIMRSVSSAPSLANRWQYSGYYVPTKQMQWGPAPPSGGGDIAPQISVFDNVLRGSVNDGLPHEYVIDLKGNSIGIDNLKADISAITPEAYNIYLGNRNGSEGYLLNAPAAMTLYSFFYKDASVKSVLVPCRDSGNNACLYDICRKVALYSSGNVPLQVAP